MHGSPGHGVCVHMSISQKLNAITCNINGDKVELQHLSGKMGLMFAADPISRNATSCTNVEKCEICKFGKENVSTCNAICISRTSADIDPFSLQECEHLLCPLILKFSTSPKEDLSMSAFTRSFMKSEQLKDGVIQKIIWYITSGSRPCNVDNTQYNVKQFLKYAKENSHPQGHLVMANDGVLKLKKNSVSNQTNTQIVVPCKYYFGFVLVAHCKLNHLTQSHLAKRIKPLTLFSV